MKVIGLKLTGLLALGLCVGPRVEGRADSVLRGFEKVFLKAGETKRVTAEPGDFDLRLGASSTDIRLNKIVTLRCSIVESDRRF